MPVRGKILNCLKADYATIFKSEIITDLLKVLGCGVEIKNKHTKDMSAFNLDDLRWIFLTVAFYRKASFLRNLRDFVRDAVRDRGQDIQELIT